MYQKSTVEWRRHCITSSLWPKEGSACVCLHPPRLGGLTLWYSMLGYSLFGGNCFLVQRNGLLDRDRGVVFPGPRPVSLITAYAQKLPREGLLGSW